MKEQNIFDIEKAALDLLLKYRKESGMSETDFGKTAFPDIANPRSKINSLWSVKTVEGKPCDLGWEILCHVLGSRKESSSRTFLLWEQADPRIKG